MRSLLRLAAIAPMLLSSLGATPLDALAPLDGHWRCTVAGSPRPAERSYFVVTTRLGQHKGRREIFGRQDTTEADGAPSASFERISENAGGGATIEAVEGTGTMTSTTPLRFTGRTNDDKSAMAITYAVTGDTMLRAATNGATTVDDERCTRERVPAALDCKQPDVRATTLHAEEPDYPVEAYVAKAKGVVQVRIVLDDRSHVMWSDVMSTPSPLLTDAAVRAARDSTFRTAIVNCRPIAAEYVFTVEFR